MISALNDLIIVLDENGYVLRVIETTGSATLGMTDAIIGTHVSDLLDDTASHTILSSIQSGLTHPSHCRFTCRFRFLDAGVWLDAAITLLRDREVMLSGKIIPERQSGEMDLTRSRALYQSLFENMLNGYAYCRMIYEDSVPSDFVYLDVNAAFTALTGMTEVVGKRVSELIPGIRKSNPELFEIYAKVASTGVAAKFETFVTGLERWFSVSVYSPGKDYFAALFEDITARKNAESELATAHERLEQLFKSVNVAIFTMDVRQNKMLLASPAHETIFGRRSEEFLRNPRLWYDLALPEDKPILDAGYPVLRSGRALQHQFRIRHTDGGIRWVEARINPTLDVQGTLIRIDGVVTDITEQKSAEEALRQSEERYRLLLGSAEFPVVVSALSDGRVLFANENAVAFFRIPEAGAEGRRAPDYWADPYARGRFIGILLDRGKVSSFEAELKTSDGETRWVLLSASLIAFKGENASFTVFSDITARKRAELDLRESEAKFRLISENVADLITLMNDDGTCLYASQSYLNLGYDPDALVGRSILEIVHPDDVEKLRTALALVVTSFKGSSLDFRIRYREGEWRNVETVMSLLINDAGARVVSVSRDITERLRNEEERKAIARELEESREFLTKIINSISDPLLVKDEECRYVLVNDAECSLSGRPRQEILGRRVQEIFPQDDMTRPSDDDARVLETGEESVSEESIVDGSGRQRTLITKKSRYIDANGNKFVVGIVRDISERIKREAELRRLKDQIEERNAELETTLLDLKRMQASLVQSEKMASLGQLTAGIAHEINNPLAFVSSNLNRFREYFTDLHSVVQQWQNVGGSAGNGDTSALIALAREREHDIDIRFVVEDFESLMTSTQGGAQRIKTIVEQLRGFAHVSESGFAPADINAAIEETLLIVWNELKYKASVGKDFGDLPPVECNIGEIKQVLVNLLVNAAHAIPEKGTVTVRTHRENTMVVVEVSDSGTGIPPENLKRIFDPFFTTKGVGKGTGLGLWITATIVEKHGGTITAESTVGEGTTFFVRLPVGRQHEADNSGGTPESGERATRV